MNLPNHSDRAIWFVIFIFLAFLIGNFIFTQYEIAQLKSNLNLSPVSNTNPTPPPSNTASTTDSCGPTCQTFITNSIENKLKVATTSGTSSGTSTQIIYQSAPNVPQITYIPLSGGSTTNTDWTNAPGSQFTLNFGDYGKNPYAVWDANLRVNNANGQTFARLYDTTHNIAVNGSEISVTNTSSSTDVVSGQLSFWQGNNSYVVQIKSLNSSTAFMDSGRIKINY